ncbi:hypothetical protein FQZ97_920880 [compost metagenome]
MTDKDSRIEADKKFAVACALAYKFLCSIRNRQQTFHQDFDHARQEQHNRCQRHAGAQNLGKHGAEVTRVIECDKTEHETYDQTHHNRLTKNPKATFDGFGVDVDLVDAGDAIHDPVQHNRDWQDLCGSQMRYRNTWNAIELLNSACRPVSKQQRQSRNECCNNNAVSDVIRCGDN